MRVEGREIQIMIKRNKVYSNEGDLETVLGMKDLKRGADYTLSALFLMTKPYI